MATGDIKNNLRKLRSVLNSVSYPNEFDLDNLIRGITTAFLPILHHIFFDFSHAFAEYLASKGYEFYGKNDLRFLEVVYKILIQEFDTKPMLTKEQFFSVGFAEVKIIFVTKIVILAKQKNDTLLKKKDRTKWTTGTTNNKKLVVRVEKSDSIIDADVLREKNARMLNYTTGMSKDEKNPSLPVTVGENSLTVKDLPNGGKVRKKNDKGIAPSASPPDKAPVPHPDLALTPIKPHRLALNKIQNTDTSIHRTGPSSHRNVDFTKELLNAGIGSELDLSVIAESIRSGDDSDLDISVSTLHEDNSEIESDTTRNTATLPICSVVRHDDVTDRTAVTNRRQAALYSNIVSSSVALPQDIACKQCSQCVKNGTLIEQLLGRLKSLESNFKASVAVNHELSARIVLLETQVKLLNESTATLTCPSNSPPHNYSNEATGSSCAVVSTASGTTETCQSLSLQNICGDVIIQKPSNSAVSKPKKVVHFQLTENHSSEKVFTPHFHDVDRQMYSPIKYTDDEEIIKDFKPIRLQDVQKLFEEEQRSILKNNCHTYSNFYGTESAGHLPNFTTSSNTLKQMSHDEDVVGEVIPSTNVTEPNNGIDRGIAYNPLFSNGGFISRDERSSKIVGSWTNQFLESGTAVS